MVVVVREEAIPEGSEGNWIITGLTWEKVCSNSFLVHVRSDPCFAHSILELDKESGDDTIMCCTCLAENRPRPKN